MNSLCCDSDLGHYYCYKLVHLIYNIVSLSFTWSIGLYSVAIILVVGYELSIMEHFTLLQTLLMS